MAYITGITLQNFRVFKDATEFDFAPLTILTGANNSGKSTVLKALLLLADSMKKNGLEELDFTGEHHHLGGLESVLNEKGKSIFTIIQFIPTYEDLSSTDYTRQLSKQILTHLLSESEEIRNYVTSWYGPTEIDYEDYHHHIDNLILTYNAYYLVLSFNYENNGMLDRLKIFGSEKPQSMNLPRKRNLSLFLSNQFEDGNFEDILSNLDELREKGEKFELETKLDYVELINRENNYKLSIFYKNIYDDIIASLRSKEELFSPYPNKYDIELFRPYLEKIFKAILQSTFQLEYLPPIKANTQRLYTYQSQGTLFNELLVQYTKNGVAKDEKKSNFINKWMGGEGFGIADKVEFVPIGTYGNAVKIWKNGKELELADLGFGITALLPLLMKITLCKTKLLLIEEPENSLHPDFQSKLADLFIDAQETFGLRFVIETHSEYLIRRLQILTAKKKITTDNTALYYFYNPDNVPKGKKQVERINIKKDGSLDNNFGEGFFDMATQMRFELLKLKREINTIPSN